MTSDVVSPDRVAVFGGFSSDPAAPGSTATGPTSDSQRSIDDDGTPLAANFSDGAIYGVSSDVWTPIPSTPADIDLSSSGAAGLFIGADLYLVSGHREGQTRDAAVLRSGTWTVLDSPTASGYFEGTRDYLAVATKTESGSFPIQYLDTNAAAWLDVRARTLAQTSRGLVALTATMDNPGDIAFGGSILTSTGWLALALADAPFVNRMEPAVAAVGDEVVIIGGDEGPNLDRKADVWILDLSEAP